MPKNSVEQRKIKVLRIINRFNIGGPTYNATFLSKFISDDFETLLVGGMPEEGEADSLHILEKYKLEPMLIEEMKREPNPISDRIAYKKLKAIIREFQPDIVHTHAAKAGALGRKAAAACNVPIILHTFHGHVFHSYFGRLKTTLFKAIERNLAKKSTRIIAISEKQKIELSEIHKICPSDKIEVVPLGFDLQQFQEDIVLKRKKVRSEYGVEEDEVAIAIIGRLAAIKDHQFFIDVLAKLDGKQSKKIKVFIVGDGTERQAIEDRLKNESFSNQLDVIMTSWIKDIATFNAGMDVICLTSKNEGTPVSLIEAQASNVPVISTDVGGVRDIVVDGETGYIVPPNNVDLYAEKLLELVENENNRRKMSQNGWSFVEDKFHYSTLCRNMENVYRKLLVERKK